MRATTDTPNLKLETRAPTRVGRLKRSRPPHLTPHLTPKPINMTPHVARTTRTTTRYRRRPFASARLNHAPFILDTFQKTKKVNPSPH